MSQDIVRQVKDDLVARGFDLSGPCGAFQITKRVALILNPTRSPQGAGLLFKDWGNNCDGYAVGIICYPDGRHYDILQDDGGLNGPVWNLEPVNVDPDRYRIPVEVDDAPRPDPRPDPVPPPPPVDLAPIIQLIDQLMVAVLAAQAELAGIRLELAGLKARPEPTHPDYRGSFLGRAIIMRPDEPRE